MTTLYHEILAVTSPEHVWSLLTTRHGLNRWWQGEVSIQGGDSWRFTNPDAQHDAIFKVVEEEPDRVLEWLCVQGPEDWQNTLIHWRIEREEVRLRLILEHRDLRKAPAQMARLNTYWGQLLNHLHRQLHQDIETLDDVELNAWT